MSAKSLVADTPRLVCLRRVDAIHRRATLDVVRRRPTSLTSRTRRRRAPLTAQPTTAAPAAALHCIRAHLGENEPHACAGCVAEARPAAPRHGARPQTPVVSRAAARPRAVGRHAPLQRRRRSLDKPSASSSSRTTQVRWCLPTGGHAVACVGYRSHRCVPARAAKAQLRHVAQRAVLRLCLNRLVSRD